MDLFKSDGDLGLSLMVNPQYEAALEISRMLRFPSAIKVNEFSNGKVELVEFLVSEDSPLVGLSLKKLGIVFKEKVLICAAQRDDKAIIPTGDFVIREGDRLFVTATMKHISLFFKHLGWNRQAKDAIIVGGSTTAYYLCKELDKLGIHAKLIEKDAQKAAMFSEDFKKINVILGDGTDQELLLEEGLATTDAFVALANMDEQNIIMSMFATSQDVPKVITKIDQLGYYDMLQKAAYTARCPQKRPQPIESSALSDSSATRKAAPSSVCSTSLTTPPRFWNLRQKKTSSVLTCPSNSSISKNICSLRASSARAN